MCSSGQLPTIAPSHCPKSCRFSQISPLPLCMQSCYLSPLPVWNKAQSRLKRSGKRRKVIKGKLMAQQSLLGTLMKWASLFLPYQSHLAQGIFDGFLVAALPGERSRWRIPSKHISLAGGLLPGTTCDIYPRVTSEFSSLLVQQSNSISVNVFQSSTSF